MREKEEETIDLFDIVAVEWWHNEEQVTTVGIVIENTDKELTLASSIMRREPIHSGVVIQKGDIENVEILTNCEYKDVYLH